MKPIIIAAIVAVAIAAIYWLGISSRDGVEARRTDKTEGRINEAIDSNRECGWYDRLLDSCE